MDFRFDIIEYYAPQLLKGTLLTIGISLAAIVVGSALGLGVGFGKMSSVRALRWPVSAYINFFRGTPLILQVLIVHFILIPPILGTTNGVVAAIAALGLNCAAYTAEIYRAGIQSIDAGQREAAYSLGLTRRQAMRFVILPQAVKRMIPAFGNEFIVLIKDSSLVAWIAVPELMYWSNAMKGQYLRVWEPYLTAALIYFILTYSLSKLLGYIERRV
ncbi:amino acid ABC transporter permease [Cohnella nanjingensis]|uniref:Amino acid ABC transporter permease n=1 Tax=Cohnella nanjingensis TaxID=1387779 RepID=A0A7X0RTX6_9BACL|nr:amino acid ABC transporter permease [Cohnella nanjingensis]MBB6673520.1 amino acid ABC transporter permease [Cohnella nanjingensis]